LQDFRFNLYPQWWLFPLLSIVITLAGLIVGFLFMGLIRGQQHRLQFLSLVTFQNSGYLPLALIAALLPPEQASPMFIYLFLFLLGFNLVIWSLGVYLLTFQRAQKFELGSLFSPPVIATILGLAVIALGGNKFIPALILRPLRQVADCTLPLALFVVGGSLASIQLKHIDKKAVSLMILAKMLILPLAGLWVIIKLKVPYLLGLLLILELAVPPATSLTVIIRHYKKEDLLISQGVLLANIVSLLTLPVFLSLYFTLAVIK
jgi:predicted permease